MDGPAQELHHGDIIEVISDFDPGVVEPGDRALYKGGLTRWVFYTRIRGGIAPIYDATLMPDDGRWKIVGRVEEEDFDYLYHTALRPERREHFLATVTRYKEPIRHLWESDLRKTQADFATLLYAIIQEEPGLLAEQILWDIMEPACRPSKGRAWWTKRNHQRICSWMTRAVLKLENEAWITLVKTSEWTRPGVRLYPITPLEPDARGSGSGESQDP